jgi:hypothetical protein
MDPHGFGSSLNRPAGSLSKFPLRLSSLRSIGSVVPNIPSLSTPISAVQKSATGSLTVQLPANRYKRKRRRRNFGCTKSWGVVKVICVRGYLVWLQVVSEQALTATTRRNNGSGTAPAFLFRRRIDIADFPRVKVWLGGKPFNAWNRK